MKIMISLSALRPSQYRKFVKGWDKGRYAYEFSKFAGKDAYRVYIPLEGAAESVISAPDDIAQAINSLGWNVEDYRAGIASDKSGKRRMRIGRLLVKHPDLLKRFNEDKNRAAYRGKFLICISRHPYDIAGASTDRGWTSCMNLVDGSQKHYIASEIHIGGLIAYLIEEHDKNLKSPTARTMIKPFYLESDKGLRNPIMIAEPSVYGTNVRGFVRSVQMWLDKHINHHAPHGLYRLHPGSYEDGYDEHLIVDTEPDAIRDKFELQEDQYGTLSSKASDDERRMAFRNHPEILSHLKRLFMSDVRCAAVHSPEAACRFLLANPHRIFPNYSVDRPLSSDQEAWTFRSEVRGLVNQAPVMFKEADHRLKFRDDEIIDLLAFNGDSIAKQLVGSRWTEEIARGLIIRLDRRQLEKALRWIPADMVPQDRVERMIKFPRLFITLDNPTPEELNAALSEANNDEWKQIIFTTDTAKLTHDIASGMISWLLSRKVGEEGEALRFVYDRLSSQAASKSPVSDDPELIIRVLSAFEVKSVDLVKNYRVCDLLRALSPEQRIARFRTGMYYNVLQAAFDEVKLRLTDDEVLALVKADEAVDFFRGSRTVIFGMWDTSQRAFDWCVEYLAVHDHIEDIMRLPNCNIADGRLWSMLAGLNDKRAANCMNHLLTSSRVFGDEMAAFYFKDYPLSLTILAEIRPDVVINDRWIQQNKDQLPESTVIALRQHLGSHRLTEDQQELLKQLVG